MKSNQEFWDELCGTNAYNALGLKEINSESLKIFDKWYFESYPYLLGKYLDLNELNDKDVLEIGLGFGTVGGQLSQYSKSYTGVDYARGPVSMMSQRISWNQNENKAQAIQGDARALPFDENTFDYVVSIGCLHHTGDTPKCIEEVIRVLKPCGKALIMLYNKNSYRKYLALGFFLKTKIFGDKKYSNYSEYFRSLYDSNSSGEAAPIISYYTKSEITEMFSSFDSIKIQTENNNFPLIRSLLFDNFSRLWGLDNYIVAVK